jgi:hypothetical protein
MTVTICYSSTEKRKMIEAATMELAEKYELQPDMFSFVDSHLDGRGEFNVEFEDDYNEEAKPFVEELAKRLNLKFEYSCTPSCGID